MGPPGGEVYNLQFIINSLLFRVNSLQLISREFDDKLQISFDFLGGFEESPRSSLAKRIGPVRSGGL